MSALIHTAPCPVVRVRQAVAAGIAARAGRRAFVQVHAAAGTLAGAPGSGPRGAGVVMQGHHA